MRYQTIPHWTYVLLVAGGVAIVAGALAFVLVVPPPAGVLVGVFWLVIGGAMAFLAMRGLRTSRDDDRLRRDGAAATATVLSTAPTHVTIDNVPQWAIRVRIDGLNAPYETTLKLLTHTPAPAGTSFEVRVDLLEHQHAVVAAGGDGDDDDEAPTAAAVDEGQAGLAAGEVAIVNADGSRTISSD